jgi:CubicO group peptidase (beta-lactamase class C family)
MEFERFLREKILGPLGMLDTGFTVCGSKLSRFATSYQVSTTGLKPIDAPPDTIFSRPPPFPYPSSGLVSSARDFARFSAMLLGEGMLDGVRILSAVTARLMMSNLLPNGVKANGQGMGRWRPRIAGLAWHRNPVWDDQGHVWLEGLCGDSSLG